MSSYNRRFVLFGVLGLSACAGYTPEYGVSGKGDVLIGKVSVDTIESRQGFVLTERLRQRLGASTDPLYQLTVSFKEVNEPVSVTQINEITRYNLLGEASYILADIATGAIVAEGRVSNFAGYSATASTVGTLAAERDAQNRLAITLADRIVAQLGSARLL